MTAMMPATATWLGKATEVTHRRVKINLTEVLPDGEDVTNSFSPELPRMFQ